MKIFIWHDKHGDVYYNASTPEALKRAYCKMYAAICSFGPSWYGPEQLGLTEYKAIKKLLDERNREGYEYETFDVEEVDDE